MATKQSTMDFIVDQTAEAGAVSSRKMFGEYALYVGPKVVALVCDDRLYLKPTDAGRALLGDESSEGAPYPGAKPHLVIPEERWDDQEWMSQLIRDTAAALPEPKPKTKATAKAAKPAAKETQATASKPSAEKTYAAHPYDDAPSATTIRKILKTHPKPLAALYPDVHAFILETLPDVRFSLDLSNGTMGYGAHQYGANGWGIGALVAYPRWLSVGFFKGASLPDPEGLLEGTGKSVRHVKLRSPEEFAERQAGLRKLLLAAAGKPTGPGKTAPRTKKR